MKRVNVGAVYDGTILPTVGAVYDCTFFPTVGAVYACTILISADLIRAVSEIRAIIIRT